MGQTPEGKIKDWVKRELDKLGADCWRFMPVQTGYGTASLDFMLCVKGRFIVIETKADAKAQLTPRQRLTARYIIDAGGDFFRVHDQETLDYTMASIRLIMEFDSAQPKRYRPSLNTPLLASGGTYLPKGTAS